MSKEYELVKNAAGRLVPTMVNGREAIPYKGVGKHIPERQKAALPIASCVNYPTDGNKVVKDLKTALQMAGISDGMTISGHHHFRNGDMVANMVFNATGEMGIKNLTWFPSAAFPCHKPMIEHMESGVIHHIEGSLNGPLGDYCSHGKMKGMGVLRSHGGRWRSVQDGDVHLDIAILAAPTADPFGNANGVLGSSACGSIFFGLVDSLYADKVIVVTDNLVPFPCIPWQIQGNNVDYVVKVDKVGDPAKIVSGTTVITKSPDRLLISEMTANFMDAAGIVKDGMSFQAGAGGTALAFAVYVKEIMKKKGVKARFIRCGSNKYLTDMLEEGLTDFLLDGQTFDLEGVRSMRENPSHVATSPFTSYNWHGKGNFASMVDAVVLGATEVDVNFNANVVSHSDGRMLHGIGGWQNCLYSKCTILPIPSLRDRIPVIVDEVTTICGPGELIDVIITERGIAINPLRKDLIEKVSNSNLPLRTIGELKEEIHDLCGGAPAKPELGDKIVAVVEWVDGTIIDSIWEVLG
jgi:citrate lyase subunit alpha/citrate CoA-transferase